MPKERTFASKVSKETGEGNKCAKCGEMPTIVMVVNSQRNESKASWRFKEQYVPVCKCNEKEVYA